MTIESGNRNNQTENLYQNSNPYDSKPFFSTREVVTASIGLLALSALTFCAARFRTARPDQWVVRTGLFIEDMSITKTAIQLPLQKYRMISVAPFKLHTEIAAMSNERIPFKLPLVLTVRPKSDMQSLIRYTRNLSNKTPEEVRDLVEGIANGESRILVAAQPLDSIFNNREEFKTNVVERISYEIDKVGLEIVNGNLEDLHDSEGNDFFNKQKIRALSSVDQKARIAESEAKKLGEIGAKSNDSDTRIMVAQLDTEAKIAENTRRIEVAQSDTELAIRRAELLKQQKIAEAESKAASEQKDCELQSNVEIARTKTETEKQRAKELSKVQVIADMKITETRATADARIIDIQATASSRVIDAQAIAEARVIQVKAEASATVTIAEANLKAKQMEAEGILAIKNAEAKGLQNLMEAAGGSKELASYLLVSGGGLVQLAHEQANALQGMNPTVSVWSTGPQQDGEGKLSSVVSDVLRTAGPLNDILLKQTGVDYLGSLGVKRSLRLIEND